MPDRDPAERELPLDPDVADVIAAETQPRPLHLSPTNLGLVALGGTVGTGLRYALSALVQPWPGVPVATFGINVVGAFVLGLLLESLVDHGPRVRWARRLRLAVGTGVLGGFTTYSALATDTAVLVGQHPALGLGYAVATVAVGGLASATGIWLGRARLRPALARIGTR